MRRFLPIAYIILGFILGLFSHPFLLKNEVVSSAPLAVEQTPSKPNSSQAPNATTTPNIPIEHIGDTPQTNESPKTCPVCPCLFSDEILPAPKFAATLKEVIETNHEGESFVKWEAVAGAKKYSIVLENSAGKIVKTYSTPRTIIYLKDIPLPEGVREADYFVRIATINGKDLPGPLGPKKQMHVKPQANLMAPSIQEIKVED